METQIQNIDKFQNSPSLGDLVSDFACYREILGSEKSDFVLSLEDREFIDENLSIRPEELVSYVARGLDCMLENVLARVATFTPEEKRQVDNTLEVRKRKVYEDLFLEHVLIENADIDKLIELYKLVDFESNSLNFKEKKQRADNFAKSIQEKSLGIFGRRHNNPFNSFEELFNGFKELDNSSHKSIEYKNIMKNVRTQIASLLCSSIDISALNKYLTIDLGLGKTTEIPFRIESSLPLMLIENRGSDQGLQEARFLRQVFCINLFTKLKTGGGLITNDIYDSDEAFKSNANEIYSQLKEGDELNSFTDVMCSYADVVEKIVHGLLGDNIDDLVKNIAISMPNRLKTSFFIIKMREQSNK